MSYTTDDDNRNAKELWGGLSRLYKTFTAQAVLNFENELNFLRFKEGESLEEHLEKCS